MATFFIPTPLRPYTNNQDEISINNGDTVIDQLNEIVEQYPDVKGHLFDSDGELRKFINVYINDEDIRYLDGGKSIVKESDEVSIIPAIAGGK